MKTKLTLTLCFILLHSSFILTALAQGTAFTYQGRLNSGSAPASGTYNLKFSLFNTNTSGVAIAGPVTNSGVIISNGLFTVLVDFGSGVFTGAMNWLEIGVETNGVSTFTSLTPRQQLTPTPYAIFAENVGVGGLSAGTYGSAVTFSNAANSFSGNFSGNGANVTNVNAATLGGLTAAGFWKTGGNTGTSPGANFVGTTDNQPLELRVNGQRGLRLEPVVNGSNFSNDVNVIGGSSVNFVAPGISGATISGGGAGSYFGAPLTNSTASDFTVIGGGAGINIQTNAFYSVIGGGHANTIQNLAVESTIGGGANNVVQAGANDSTISGGDLNSIATNSAQSTIGGGYNNIVQPLAAYATIGGGGLNTIQNGAYDSTIGAGYNNTIQANAHDSVISGGNNNMMQPTANNSTIGGGANNKNQANYGTLSGGQSNYLYGTGSTLAGGVNNANTAYQGGTLSGGQGNFLDIEAGFSSVAGGLQNTNGGIYSAIGGGWLNSINVGSANATIAGGTENTVSAPAFGATISGGEFNTAGGTNSTVGGGNDNQALGFDATVPGGFGNAAVGVRSFAAGTFAQAYNQGCFVWGDSQFANFTSTANDQFLIRAQGGVGIGINSPAGALHVASGNPSPQVQITQNNSSDYTRLRMNVTGYPSWEMDVSPGAAPGISWWTGSLRMNLDYNGNLTTSGTVNGTSDRNAKEKFTAVSSREVLDKVAALPITEWNFKNESEIRHIGPMAQDFYAAFSVGMDDKHIATVDEGGVALAAIQGLKQEADEKDARIQQLEQTVNALQKLVEQMSQKLAPSKAQ
jgi:hypothetical protein